MQKLGAHERLEWVWDGDVEKGYSWVRQWVEKGGLNLPRTGHIARLINEEIWACGGVTPGDIYEQETVLKIQRKDTKKTSNKGFLKLWENGSSKVLFQKSYIFHFSEQLK